MTEPSNSVLIWWRRGDSNSRPRECDSRALPTELRPHLVFLAQIVAYPLVLSQGRHANDLSGHIRRLPGIGTPKTAAKNGLR